jgi:hypothetical protein
MSRRLAQLLCAGMLGGSLGLSVAWAQNPSIPGIPGASTTPSLPTGPSSPGTGTGSGGATQFSPACLYGMDARGNCLPTPGSPLGTASPNQLPAGPGMGMGGTGLYTQPNTYTTPGTAGTFGTETTAPGTYSTPGTVTQGSRTLSPRTFSPDFGATPNLGSPGGTGTGPMMGPGSTSSPGPGLSSPGASPTLPQTGPTTIR